MFGLCGLLIVSLDGLFNSVAFAFICYVYGYCFAGLTAVVAVYI